MSGQEPEKYNNKFLESSNKKESCETLALPRSLPQSLLYLQPGSHPGVRWDNPVNIQKVNLALLGSTHCFREPDPSWIRRGTLPRGTSHIGLESLVIVFTTTPLCLIKTKFKCRSIGGRQEKTETGGSKEKASYFESSGYP